MKTGSRAAETATPPVRQCRTCGALLDDAHLEESRDGLRCVFCGALQASSIDKGRAQVPMGLGETLREVRESRGESLEHASGETRINERFLRALEEDAPCDAYPGAIYGRFFLREYAEYLGLDKRPLLDAYDHARSEAHVVPVRDRALPKKPSGGYRFAIVAVAAVALMVIAALSWAGGQREAASPGGPSFRSPTGVRSAPPSQRGPTTNTPEGVQATLHLRARCWIRAVVDGRTLDGRTFPAGTERTFRAHRTLELTLGYAGGVRLWVNGQRVQTGASGQVVHFSFTWRHGRLVGGRA